MPPQSHEYRVVWMRAGFRRPKLKRYATRAGAERFMRLLGPEPWTDPAVLKMMGKKSADEKLCCSGYECGCGGETVREHIESVRHMMPALIWVRLDARKIGFWATQATKHEAEQPSPAVRADRQREG